MKSDNTQEYIGDRYNMDRWIQDRPNRTRVSSTDRVPHVWILIEDSPSRTRVVMIGRMLRIVVRSQIEGLVRFGYICGANSRSTHRGAKCMIHQESNMTWMDYVWGWLVVFSMIVVWMVWVVNGRFVKGCTCVRVNKWHPRTGQE